MTTRLEASRRTLEVAARGLGVVACVVLALATGTLGQAWQQLAMVAILAIAASLPRRPPWLRYATILAEAAVAALIVLAAPSGVRPSIAYLIVPPVVAALAAGALGVLSAVAVSGLVLVVGTVTAQGTALPAPVAEIAVWLALAIVLGLAALLIRHVRERVAPSVDSYATARALLASLRDVARRLPGGLEESVLARATLEAVDDILRGDRAAVFLTTGSGAIVEAARSGPDDPAWTPHWSRDIWAQAWDGQVAIQRPGRIDGPEWGDSACAVIPLRLDGRPTGVVAVEREGGLWDIADLSRAQERVDEAALRLDAARLFDDVRALATTEERRRVSREIHDGIAQELAGLGLLVDDLVRDAGDPQMREGLERLRGELTRLVTELRLSIFDLRAEGDAGIGEALSTYAHTVGTESGMTVHLVIDEDGARLPAGTGPEVLRIAQEAMTNAHRHAQARTLWVTYRVDPEGVRLRIADDGRGFTTTTARPDSFGLTIMRERARRIGGDLTVRARDGGGTVVEMSVTESPGAR